MKNERKRLTLFRLSFWNLFGAWKIVGMTMTEQAAKTQPNQDKSFSFIFHLFNCLSVVQVLFCGLIKGISLKICILCVCVQINKHLFEPFCVWIFVLER